MSRVGEWGMELERQKQENLLEMPNDLSEALVIIGKLQDKIDQDRSPKAKWKERLISGLVGAIIGTIIGSGITLLITELFTKT